MNPYEKVKQNSVYGMSQGELLVLLYDEAIRDVKRSQAALEDKDYDLFDKNMDYTVRIVRYLMNTLDLSVPISFDLRRLYEYLIFDLGKMRAGRERQSKEFPGVLSILQNLRDGFDGASRKVTDTHVPQEQTMTV